LGEKLLGEKSDFFDWKKHHVDKRHIQVQSAEKKHENQPFKKNTRHLDEH